MILSPPSERLEFDRNLAMQLCQASGDAYLPDRLDDAIRAQWGAAMTTLIDIPETDTQARIIADDRFVILAFRGTSSAKDARTDLRAQRRQWKYGHAHAGFLDSWKSIRPTIEQELRRVIDTNGQQLYVTGHSLGGALATLCAYEFELHRMFSVENLYTFGSPRAFSRAGAAHARQLIGKTYFRVVHSNDGVARVPRLFRRNLGFLPNWIPWMPTPFPLRHLGRLIFLTEDGHILGDRKPVRWSRLVTERVTGFRFDFGRDHLITGYLEGLT